MPVSYLPPPEPPKPFVRPVGEFEEPKHFESETEARNVAKVKGGIVEKDFIKGKGWLIMFARKR